MNAFALVEAAHALTRNGRHEDAESLLHQCIEDYPKSPWSAVGSERLKPAKGKLPPPHALAEAGKLLALGPQPVDPLDPLGDQQPSDGTVLENLLDRVCEAAILGRPPVLRPIPSPLLRLTMPELFENRGTVRVRSREAVEDLPAVAPLK